MEQISIGLVTISKVMLRWLKSFILNSLWDAVPCIFRTSYAIHAMIQKKAPVKAVHAERLRIMKALQRMVLYLIVSQASVTIPPCRTKETPKPCIASSLELLSLIVPSTTLPLTSLLLLLIEVLLLWILLHRGCLSPLLGNAISWGGCCPSATLSKDIRRW